MRGFQDYTFFAYIKIAAAFVAWGFASILLLSPCPRTLDKALDKGYYIVDMQVSEGDYYIFVKNDKGDLCQYSVSAEVYSRYLSDFNSD